jgi:hypothetical protein
MNFFQALEAAERPRAKELFARLEEEISEALGQFWSVASGILRESGIRLLEPPADYSTLRRNFFSALFLYSYHRAGIPHSRRIFYATVNHCLRAMVTGCDNLLDDEYKPTLVTDLPEKGFRFRSVLDIMVADRVLFEILLEACRQNMLDPERITEASASTLRALTRSGIQEATEEQGIDKVLEPEAILSSVHHFKTGMLFQCPWAVPRLIETTNEEVVSLVTDALYRIGMGCQIMDDMVDFATDLAKRRHNYIRSVVHHGADPEERSRLADLLEKNRRGPDGGPDLILDFPRALAAATGAARSYLEEGLFALFTEDLAFLVPPVMETLATLIGADRFMACGNAPC